MKNLIFIVVITFASTHFYSQTTLIPDPAFEEWLIYLGHDTNPINGSVPTANISSVTGLPMSAFTPGVPPSISDLTGLEDFTSLTWLDISSHGLTSLDVSVVPTLISLECYGNNLTQLDLSQNPALKFLDCHTNSLTQLDLSNNPLVDYLSCYFNQITELDLGHLNNLEYLSCEINSLNCLNIKNGNNINMFPFGMLAGQNPNLTCIEVDDPVWAANTWTVSGGFIDSTASFSNNCNNNCSSIPTSITQNKSNSSLIFPNPVSSGNDLSIVQGETENFRSVVILDITGKIIYQEDFFEKLIRINTSKLPKGSYFIQLISSEGKAKTEKLSII